MVEFTPHEASVHNSQALSAVVPPKLIGRDATLAAVYAHLKQNQAVLIYGTAGIGKTALAATLANAYTQQPGGVLWLNVENSPLEELIARVGRAYQITEITDNDNPLAMVGAVANTLTQNKPLIVLDGELTTQTAADFVTRCAAGLPLMLVSDVQLEGPWAPIKVDKLDEDAATLLFKLLAGIKDEDQLDEDIGALVGVLDHTPFAVTVAARALRAAKQTPAEFLANLPSSAAGSTATAPMKALTASFRSLNNALQGIVLMLGATFTSGLSSELLSMVSGVPEDRLEQVMRILSQFYLVERIQRYDQPYYRLHTLIYSFAQGWLRGSQQEEALHKKMRDTILAYAQKYAADTPEAHNKLAAEIDTFVATAEWATEQGDREFANQIVVAIMQAGDFVNTRGFLYELLQLRHIAASFTTAFPAYADEAAETPAPSAPALPEKEVTPFAGVEYDDIDDDEDDADDDIFEEPDSGPAEAVEISKIDRLRMELAQAREQNDVPGQINKLRAIGEAQVQDKMENEAIATFTQVLTFYENRDDSAGALDMLDTLARLMVNTENSQAAVLHARRGILLAQELDEPDSHMHLAMTLGDAHQQLGESAESIKDYEQALEIARTRDDSINEATILYQLGYAQLDNSDTARAIETWEQALVLFKHQTRRDYEGRTFGGLGAAHSEQEKWSEAVNFYTSALHIAREVGDGEEEMLQLNNLGYATTQAKRLSEAPLRYRQALHLAFESKNRDNIVSNIVDLVRLFIDNSRRHYEIAELLINEALTLEPHDHEVNQLKQRIESERASALEEGIEQAEASGTAQDYAANAYAMLDS